MTALAVVGALLGLVIGSFLNVVAYRVPLEKSVVSPPSACPACGSQIRARDNVPVLSWLLLRGHCRDCGVSISGRYPLVEATTAVLFAAAAIVVGASWVLPAYWWFVGLGVALVLTDLDHKRIPNRILYPGTAVAVVLLAIGAISGGETAALVRGFGGGAAYFTFLLIVALVARGGFGFGDVKLAFVLGVFTAYQSWGALAVAVMAAFLLGGVVSITLLALGKADRKTAIPFGPSLIAGAFIAVAAGDRVMDWYLG